VCTPPSFGIQGWILRRKPASKTSDFNSSRNLDNSRHIHHSRRISIGIILFKSYTALIPTPQSHQQLQHRHQIYALELVKFLASKPNTNRVLCSTNSIIPIRRHAHGIRFPNPSYLFVGNGIPVTSLRTTAMLDGSSLAQSPQTSVYSTVSRFVACGSILSVIPLSFHRMWLNPLSYSTVVSSNVAQSSLQFIPLSVVSSHVAQSSQSYPRSLVRTFSIKALDHAPQLFNLDFAFSVFMLQLVCCPWQAFSYHRGYSHIRIQSLFASCCGSSVLTNNSLLQMLCFWQTSIKITAFFAFSLIHEYRPSALSRQTVSIRYPRYRYPPRSTEHIPLSLVFPYATDSLRHSAILWFLQFVSSASRILEVSHFIAAPYRRRPLKSTSRTTAPKPRWSSPLERAYCHEQRTLP
jgi:hypothetical protein